MDKKVIDAFLLGFYGYQPITEGEKKKMGNISLNEALGRRESKLLSEAVGQAIEISSVEMENGTDNTGKAYERAYINTTDGATYRSSNKAVLTKAKAIASNLPKGSTVTVKVVQKKGKTGGYKYLDLEAV